MKPRMRSWTLVAGLLVLAMVLPSGLWSQGFGTITGIVKDTTGSVIPGVTVTVTNANTGSRATVTSQADGVYRTPQLPPATYTVSAEFPSFKRLDITGLKLSVGSSLTQDLTMEIGVVTETVEVSGQSSLVETTSGEVGTPVSTELVLEMALADRNVYRLVNLVPGAYIGVGGAAGTLTFVGGSRGWATHNTIDGVNNTRGGLGIGNVETSPPVDSMQEFKVQLTSYSAEYGRSANGQITAVTKSGTNQFHGSVYEFLRNDKLDAAGWGNDQKPPLRRNNFGGTVGGPIIPNRTFFFFNFDGLRQNSGVTVTRNVGLPEWKQGDFSRATRQAGSSAVLVPIYDPATGTGTVTAPRGNTQFPDNRIPVSQLDPVALKAVTYIPEANRAPDNSFNQAGNWQMNRVNLLTRDYYISRVDHDFTDSTKMFVRWLLVQPDKSETPALPGWGDGDPNAGAVPDRHQNAGINITHLFSPTLFANATIGFNRTRPFNQSGQRCCEEGIDFAAELGIPNAPGFGFPQFVYGGGSIPLTNIGYLRAGRLAAFTNTDFIGNFTKVSGNHTLKFGGQYARYNGNVNVIPGAGSYNFSGRFTQAYNANGGAMANTGINFADFLLGRMNSASLDSNPTIGKRIQYYAGYFQDDWRVTPRLTLNLGVRYEVQSPPYGINDNFANFDAWAPNPRAGTGDIPAGAIGVVTFQNRNGEGKYLNDWDKNNFSPRFGFAYRLTDKGDTVVRGGFGLYYGNPIIGATVEAGRDPFGQTFTAGHPVPFRLRDGPTQSSSPPDESEFTPTWGNRGTKFAQASIFAFSDRNALTNYSQNFNLNFQHQWKEILFEVGYLGNLSRHVPTSAVNLNRIPENLLSQTSVPERLRRPWTIFASNQAQIPLNNAAWGISNYHAFTFKSERRYASGYGWLISYTATKWIDNVPFFGGGNPTQSNELPQNIYDLKGERSLSTGSIPHRLVVSPIVELPFGKGRRWMDRGGVMNAVFGGWEISTIATFQTGTPFGTLVLNGGRDHLGDSANGVVLRPDLLRDPNLSDGVQGTPAVGVRGIQWFDPAAFAIPAPFTYGSAARTIPGIYSPGLINFDSMLAKNIRIRERLRLQIRWETLNTFNTPAWDTPDSNLGAGNFGNITSAGGRRIMQMGMKLYW